MKVNKKILGLLIATALTTSTLLIPSVGVYAATTSNLPTINPATSGRLSTSSTSYVPSYVPSNVSQYIYDPVHKEYIGIGNDHAEDDPSFVVGYIYTSNDGTNWTRKALPNNDIFNTFAIATNEKGTIVIGADHVKSDFIEDEAYTSNDGGLTWKETMYSYDAMNYSTGTFDNPLPNYVGVGTDVIYFTTTDTPEGLFRIDGNSGSVLSRDGYTWGN